MIAEGLNHSNTKRKVSSKTRKLRTHKTEQFIKWMALISNLSAGKFIADVRTAKDQFIYNNLSVKK